MQTKDVEQVHQFLQNVGAEGTDRFKTQTDPCKAR